MGGYYSNALFTIAATGVSSSRDDFLTEGSPRSLLVSPCNVTITKGGDKSELYTLLPTGPSWKVAVDRGPLYRRGWTLQERIMSTRIVHFTRDAVFWECSELCAMEFRQTEGLFLGEVDIWNPRPGDYFASRRRRVGPRYLREQNKDADLLDDWMELVEQFTQMDFSVITDKLVAISGIAETFSHRGAGDFLAGIWQTTLPQGLAWFSSCHRSTCLPKPYIAPSWSWASVHAIIKQFDKRRDYAGLKWVSSIISIDVHHTHSNLFGQISGGKLSLRGRLQELELVLSRYGVDGSNEFFWANYETADDDVESVESDSTLPLPYHYLTLHPSQNERGLQYSLMILQNISERLLKF